MGTLKNLYDVSPQFLRDLYVNVYGIRNTLRLREWNRLIRDIEYTEKLDREGQMEYVGAGLKSVIDYAISNVPFYKRFSTLKKDLDKRNVFDLLKEFPVVDKATINKEPEAFLSRNHGNSVISRTSGTTGTPLLVHMDKHSFVLGDALWWRRTKWAGYEEGDWIARLVGDPIIPLRIKEPDKPWVISRFDRRIYLSTFHLNEKTAESIGRLLNRQKPAYIMGYPSSLEILCSFLKETGFKMSWDLKSVLFSSEPMHAYQEMIVREVLQSEIRGLFGSGEKVVSAAQCDVGQYHLSLVDGFVEGQFGVMDNMQPAAVTTLTNKVMPLIRYQVGDVIETRPSERCDCGRTLPMISPVITKHEDWIVTPSGRKIAPSAVVWAFIHQEIKDIKKGQVVQEDERSIKVYLSTDPESFTKYKNMLKDSMEKVFFGEMDVEIIRTDRIEVETSGKSRFILNKLNKGNGASPVIQKVPWYT